MLKGRDTPFYTFLRMHACIETIKALLHNKMQEKSTNTNISATIIAVIQDTATHSASTSHSGRHTRASTIRRGVPGKRRSI